MSYVPSKCGCAYQDGEQTRWCAHHVSDLTETIKARERELRDQRYRVRKLEKIVEDYATENRNLRDERDELQSTVNILREQKRYMADVRKERDEWKAKAERLEEQGWLDPGEATHYCCMHMRWETQEGAEV